MNLTRAQAIEEHRKMWHWIADETAKKQKAFRPEDYLKKFYPDKMICWSSFCCEYANPIMNENCDRCPIDWKSTADRYMCGNKDNNVSGKGFLERWLHAVDYGDYFMATHYAALIAELPSRCIRTEKINNTEKPPVGVKPYYISSGERINSLAEAIQRYSTTKNYKTIKLWAGEIICQCKLVEIMTEYENSKNSESMDN